MAFDQKCYDLAKDFIDDGSTERTYALSQRIQDAIEDWLTENKRPTEEYPDNGPTDPHETSGPRTTQQTADIVARLRAGITITLGEEYCPDAGVLDDAACEIERLAAVNAELLAVLKDGLSLKGGWREAIVELEDHCSERVRLRNMVAAADQLDKWAVASRDVIAFAEEAESNQGKDAT